MSDDVRDRAREILAGVGSPCGDAIGGIGAREAVSLLDAAGIALVDAELATWFRERIAQQREEIERLEDERRRLLAFRDAVDGFETALGVYENCMDAHCGVGGFCDDQQRQLAEAIQRKGMARAAVAGIESEGE